MSRQQIEQLRREKDAAFKSSDQSPLLEEQMDYFEGLNYYDYNPDLDLTVTIQPFNDDATVQIITNRNEIRNYRRYGLFTFTVDGQEARLTIYETQHGFFLPFVDVNAGTETYSAGRYLDLTTDDGKTFHVDFNRAYNPLCAYNDQWNCPITPKENRLTVAIRAGEKIPTGEWVK